MTIKKTVFLLLCALSLLWANIASAEVIDKIIVVVNGEAITQGEVDRLLAPFYYQYRSVYSEEEMLKKLEEGRQKIIEQLVDDRLILSEAKRLNIEPDEREVENRLADAEARAGSRKKFERALLEQHLSIKDIKMRYREQTMTQKLIKSKVGSRVSVSPIEIEEYYKNHPEEFAQPEEIKLRNIFIKPQEGVDIAKTEELAKDVMERLKKGGDFAALAKTYSEGPGASEGGLMGSVKKGDLLPELEKAAFALKEGEVSEIIKSQVGYHIFKMEEKKEAKALPLNEVERDVEERIYREKVHDKLKAWVATLKKTAYIAFK